MTKKSLLPTLMLLLGLTLTACVSFPTEGQRIKTLADTMDEVMRTKDPAWLKSTMNNPDKIDTSYPGYVLWIWNATFKRQLGNSQYFTDVPCYQTFILDKKNNIVGWDTDCAPDKPVRVYGKTASTTPIPNPVIPATIAARIKTKQDAQRTRSATFADLLAAQVGKTEEQIHTWYKNIDSVDKLGNGKVIKTYYITWSEVVSMIRSTDYTCKFSLSFVKGKVVGYDAGNCKDAWPDTVNGMKIHYKKPAAPWRKL